MAAATTPIFPIVPNYGFGKVLAANTATDGTGTTVLLFTAGANGAFVERIIARHLGTNVASVLRLFVNNGGAVGTATNNVLIFEKATVANTLSQTAQSDQTLEIIANLKLNPTYRIYGSVGTVLAAGLGVTVQGGDY